MINTHAHKKLFNGARRLQNRPERSRPGWTEGRRRERPAGRVRLPAAVPDTRCCPPAWHLPIPVGPHSSFHPGFLLFEGRAPLPAVVSVLRSPDPPGQGGGGCGGPEPRVGSWVWGPQLPSLTLCLLPYPPWPSCARMGVGVAGGALGLQRSHSGQRGACPFPSLCISLSLPLSARSLSAVLGFCAERCWMRQVGLQGLGEGLAEAQGCGGGDSLL